MIIEGLSMVLVNYIDVLSLGVSEMIFFAFLTPPGILNFLKPANFFYIHLVKSLSQNKYNLSESRKDSTDKSCQTKQNFYFVQKYLELL